MKQNKTNTQMPDEFWDEWRLVTGALKGRLVSSRDAIERWRKVLHRKRGK